MENKKTLEQLEEVRGGLAQVFDRFPQELQERLALAKSDVELCKLLADNGYDVEKLQKLVPDDILNQIGGGFDNILGTEIYCPSCGTTDSEDLSFQVLASFKKLQSKYRCRKCDCFFKLDATGRCVEVR